MDSRRRRADELTHSKVMSTVDSSSWAKWGCVGISRRLSPESHDFQLSCSSRISPHFLLFLIFVAALEFINAEICLGKGVQHETTRELGGCVPIRMGPYILLSIYICIYV